MVVYSRRIFFYIDLSLFHAKNQHPKTWKETIWPIWIFRCTPACHVGSNSIKLDCSEISFELGWVENLMTVSPIDLTLLSLLHLVINQPFRHNIWVNLQRLWYVRRWIRVGLRQCCDGETCVDQRCFSQQLLQWQPLQWRRSEISLEACNYAIGVSWCLVLLVASITVILQIQIWKWILWFVTFQTEKTCRFWILSPLPAQCTIPAFLRCPTCTRMAQPWNF